MSKKIKVIEITKAPYVRLLQMDGENILLNARPVNPDDFEGHTLYAMPASRGKVKGETEFFVTLDTYLANKPERASRQSVSDKIKSLSDSGMSADEILAQLLK